MKTILVSNRKGGVGKTTTALNLASILAKKNNNVLLIDLDTQGHLQYGLGIKNKFKKGMHKALETEDLSNVIKKTSFENLYFGPADINYDISSLIISPKTLKRLIEDNKLSKKFDYCIIDTPPTSDILLKNAMIASDYVVVPMQTEYLGFLGALQFLKLFYNIASDINADIKFLGVLPTLFNKSIKEHKTIIENLKQKLGANRVFEPIRKDFKLSQSFIAGKPIIYFDEKSRGSRDYQKFTNEVLKKIKTL